MTRLSLPVVNFAFFDKGCSLPCRLEKVMIVANYDVRLFAETRALMALARAKYSITPPGDLGNSP